jgi:hypothetical protein
MQLDGFLENANAAIELNFCCLSVAIIVLTYQGRLFDLEIPHVFELHRCARERTNNIVGHLHHKKQFRQDRLGTNEGNDCLWSGRAWFAVGGSIAGTRSIDGTPGGCSVR